MAASIPGKAAPFKIKHQLRLGKKKKEDKVEKLQFEEEDFPSLNPEAGKQNQPCRPVGTPSGVWEAKQPSKMLVIKKISKEDPAAAFSAAFSNSGSHHANWGKKCQLWSQVAVRTWCLSLHHLPPSPTPGKLTEWSTNLDHFAQAGSLLLPIQFLLLNQWYWLLVQVSALPKRVPPGPPLRLRSAPLA